MHLRCNWIKAFWDKVLDEGKWDSSHLCKHHLSDVHYIFIKTVLTSLSNHFIHSFVFIENWLKIQNRQIWKAPKCSDYVKNPPAFDQSSQQTATNLTSRKKPLIYLLHHILTARAPTCFCVQLTDFRWCHPQAMTDHELWSFCDEEHASDTSTTSNMSTFSGSQMTMWTAL